MERLTPEQYEALTAALQAMGMQAAPEPGLAEPQDASSGFEPLLQGVAAVARGEAEGRGEIEALLPQLEEDGWHIADAVRRIWAGERDAGSLTAGLNAEEAALVRRVLELLETPS